MSHGKKSAAGMRQRIEKDPDARTQGKKRALSGLNVGRRIFVTLVRHRAGNAEGGKIRYETIGIGIFRIEAGEKIGLGAMRQRAQPSEIGRRNDIVVRMARRREITLDARDERRILDEKLNERVHVIPFLRMTRR